MQHRHMHRGGALILGLCVLGLGLRAGAEVPQALVDELGSVIDQGLSSTQPLARAWALRARALQGGRAAQTALLGERDNTEELVRLFAGLGLIELGRREGPATVSAVLASASSASRRRYLDRYVRDLPEDAQEAVLRQTLEAITEPAAAGEVSTWIAREGQGPVLALLGRAASAPEAIRQAMVQALVDCGRPEIADVAADLARSHDAAVRLDAVTVAKAAGQAGRSVLESLLTDGDAQVSGAAALALAPMGVAAAYDRLLQTARQAEGDLRSQALEAIRDGRPTALGFDDLHAMLDASDDADWQRLVYEALGASGSDQAWTLISGMASSDVYEERSMALSALGYTGREDAVPILSEALLTSQRPELRTSAAEGLGRLGLASCATPLTQALDRERGGPVKLAVIQALGQIPTDDVVWPLVYQLANDDSEVVIASLEALRQHGGAQAAPQVETVATSGHSPEERWAAALTLLALDPEVGQIRLMQALDAAPEGFMSDIDALPEAIRVQAYQRLAVHSDPDVRALAVSRIARLPDDGVSLWRQLADPSTPSDVRQVAVGVLTARRDPQDLPLFLGLVDSASQGMRMDALEAVIELADPSTEQALRGLLQANEEERRVMAVYGLWRLGATH